MLKIIFKNRVFAKNLHSLIHFEFSRIFERGKGVLHKEKIKSLLKNLPKDLLYKFL